MRLDQFLPQGVAALSRSLVRKVIDIGGVHVNGQRIRTASRMLASGDLVELYLDHLPLVPWRISSQDVVFQDNYLIVINKPATIETQPTHARYKGTLYEALQVYLQDPFRPHQKPEIGMVQRLDRSTSGLIVFSIHPKAHKKMTELFKDGHVDKIYLALVSGQPASAHGEIRSLLARSRRENRVHSVTTGGKPAITRYRMKSRLNSCSLLEVQILTGRSHQIRAHMAELGCPLLGDQRYGGPMVLDGMMISRPMLHAQRLKFLHPLSAQPLEVSVPMPADMDQALQFLKEVK
ncbi:RluA family pseudouridine synthase [Pelobacter sp. M08fum]|uniref:Pseudouridine synthase n=2 Tax=Pelovirga terrestris TaxID=2771352 RepID=A0A8J6QUZ2_9BACT|nr:RluA family pseudouridine synthase [Pelovirga terrestris]